MATRNLQKMNTLHLDLVRQFGATGISRNLQESLLMDQCPTFLFNKLPVELISKIFQQAFYSLLHNWDARAFSSTLQATALTCSRIRHALQSDPNLWRAIVAVASSPKLIADQRFNPLLETCAELSCKTLDYIDFSRFFRCENTIKWMAFANCLKTVIPSSEHLKVLKGPIYFFRQLRCYCPVCVMRGHNLTESAYTVRPRDSIPEAIFLLFRLLRQASNLDLLSLYVFEAGDIVSQELYNQLPQAGPRSVHLSIDLLRQEASTHLVSFYPHLCRRAEELNIELQDHLKRSDHVMDVDHFCLPMKILEAASSTVRCLTISTNQLASRFTLPSSMPALQDFKFFAGGRDIQLSGGVCNVPSLNNIHLPAELLARFDAPNVKSATLLIQTQEGAANIVEQLPKWSWLSRLILVIVANSRLSSEAASLALRNILDTLMDSPGKPLCCPALVDLNVASQHWIIDPADPQHSRLSEVCFTMNNDLEIGSELLQLESQRRCLASADPDPSAEVKQGYKEEHGDQSKLALRCKPLSIDHIQGCGLEKARNSTKYSGPPITWQLTSDRSMVQ